MVLHPEDEELHAADVLRSWTPDVAVWIALVLAPLVYGMGVYRLWKHAGRGSGIRPREAAAYALGILSLVIALVSPLDYLSDLAFFAHMAQHEILMLVAAPLVVLGRPMIALLWALPTSSRHAVATALQSSSVRSIWRAATHPIAVVLYHGLVVWLWHAKPLFEAAMRNEWIHGVQHLSFFVTAALFWWAIAFGRYGRTGYGLGVLFVFATAAHTSLLGALLTVAQGAWYGIYEGRSRRLGLDALDDQRLAGLVMWIPGGAILLLAVLALLLAWLGEARRRAERATV